MSQTKEYFKLLGITPTLQEAEIKKAYRKMALKYHPDKNKSSQAVTQFIKISEAYNYLKIVVEKANKKGTDFENLQQEEESELQQQWKDPYPFKSEQDLAFRLKRAKQIYEILKEKQEIEQEKHFQKITSGKHWIFFKIIVFFSSFLALIFIIDTAFLPVKQDYGKIIKLNPNRLYMNLNENIITPVTLSGNQKILVDYEMAKNYSGQELQINRTAIFKEVKNIGIMKNGTWHFYPSEFSTIQVFPLIPILLLIPLFTFFLKSKKMIFMVLFNICLFMFPIAIILLLFLNNRLLHLLSFDYF